MKMGLISDIHGNRHALEAVVADAAEQGVSRWWVLGDLVAIGPDPVRTVELIANLPCVEITSGNTERYVLTDDRPPPHPDAVIAEPELLPLYALIQRSFAWTCGALAAHGWLEWLRKLPLEARTDLADGTVALGVHASPGKDDGAGITPDRDEEELRVDLADIDAQLVFAGHTHRPTDRVVGGVRAVNLGSLSNPITDDLRASYVVVHADRHGHGVEHRRVTYDRDAFLEAVDQSGHPASDYIASFQRGEQSDTRHDGPEPGDAGRRDAVRMLVIDAANVIGSRPTGWWRDRPGAARSFTERVRATVTAGRLDPPVTVVLEGRARAGADEAHVDGVEVVHAPGEGDDTIAAIAEAHREVIVVTADRELAERARAANAEVVGPNWLLDQLVD